MNAPMRFNDKVAVVIGGNSGIGLAAAQAFAAEGAKVVITGRDAATLDSAATQIGPGALALQADVADLEATDRVMQTVREHHGRIDVLLVNAGVGTFAPVREVTEALWDQVHGINLKGCFFAAQKALPLMGRGSAIVFTGSIGSVLALPGNSIYAAAKAGCVPRRAFWRPNWWARASASTWSARAPPRRRSCAATSA